MSEVDRNEGVFAIKPSGVPYEQLRIEDMVIMDFNNQIVEDDEAVAFERMLDRSEGETPVARLLNTVKQQTIRTEE